jgi:charged multivesicular body protein 5
MEDLIEQANEIQESMSRTYGVPDELDEADLEAGRLTGLRVSFCLIVSH